MAKRNSIISRPIRDDISGRRFGRLIVLGVAPARNGRRRFWICRCDCGIEKEIARTSLVTGDSRSCGCLNRENIRTVNRVHGMAQTKEYTAWEHIKKRCYTPTDKAYPDYGGRGITVCDRWKDSFEAFYADMGPAPSPDHQIDRINNDGAYSAENCRWATRSQQCRNRRSSVRVAYRGEIKLLIEWSEIVGIPYLALYKRIFLRGWTPEEAMNIPLGSRK